MRVRYVKWLAMTASVAAGVVGATLLSRSTDSTAAELMYSSEAHSAVDAAGNLRVPEGYPGTYEYLGSWAIADEKGAGAKQIHEVFASPGTIAAYRQSGRFPDGTVLIKEVRAGATAPMTTGIVSHAEKLAGWFVMVKDNVGRFAGNKLWGDGWGWSWFDATDPQKTTSTDYTTDCKSCHVPARGSDWIYTRGYPALNR
jgi:Cytochrome P460